MRAIAWSSACGELQSSTSSNSGNNNGSHRDTGNNTGGGAGGNGADSGNGGIKRSDPGQAVLWGFGFGRPAAGARLGPPRRARGRVVCSLNSLGGYIEDYMRGCYGRYEEYRL